MAQSRLLFDALCRRVGFKAYCSPQGRALATADIVLKSLALSAKTDARLCEISVGKWQGLTFDEIAKGWPVLLANAEIDPLGWHFHAPDGETFDQISARSLDFLQDLTDPSIIITHGITSRILRGHWLGLGYDEMVTMPGGQGCVYHLSDRAQVRLS